MQEPSSAVSYSVNTLDYTSRISYEIKNAEAVETRHIILNSDDVPVVRPEAPFPLFQGAAQSAQNLYEKYKAHGPVVLALSGGLDSQALLYSFLESGVPFKAAVMQFDQRLNEHDIGHCLDLLQYHGIQPEIHNIDILKFYESGRYLDYARQGQTNSPQFAAHAWLAEQIQGVPVFSGEPWHRVYSTQVKPSDSSDLTYYLPHFKEYATEIFLKSKNRTGVSHFFEFSLAWLRQAVSSENAVLYRNAADPEASYRSKFLFYRSMGFPVSLTSSFVKLTGFERVYVLYAALNNSGDFFYFNDVFRKPLEKEMPPPAKQLVQLEGLGGEFWRDLKILHSPS